MRMRLGQNIVRRARRDEFLQHLASQEARILHPAIELAVGKSPRPALAELDIAVGIQLGPAPQAPCILGPLPHHLAPVQDDRAEAHLREDQPRDQAARSRDDDDGPLARPDRTRTRLNSSHYCSTRMPSYALKQK